MTIVRETRLWFREGTSDKVYIAQVILRDDGTYIVVGQWGRRGKTMQKQIKGTFGSEWLAVSCYMNLVASKTGKGYEVTARTAFC